MKDVARKSLIKDIGKTIQILQSKTSTINEELKDLSDHTIQDVALYKNMDAVSLAVLIYAISKVHRCVVGKKHEGDIILELQKAQKALQNKKFGSYNKSLAKAFDVVEKCGGEMKKYVRDVVYASKIKKGVTLIEKGVSVRRAASVIGISEWDLLSYTGRSHSVEEKHEKVPAKKRVTKAIEMFTKKEGQHILFFDAGPLITLAMSRLLWVLPKLKENFGGKFYITESVRQEVIDKPKTIRRFQFEALEIEKLIRDGILELYIDISQKNVKNLQSLSNKTYRIKEKWLEIIQVGEMETVAASLKNENAPIVIDERTMRLLLEDEKSLEKLLERRNRKKVTMDEANVAKFKAAIKGDVPILRSVELVTAAFHLGLIDMYLPKMNRSKEFLLDSVLWNVKFNGAAITEHEIEEIKQFSLREVVPKKVTSKAEVKKVSKKTTINPLKTS